MKKKINVKECIKDDTLDLSMLGLQEVPVKDIAVYHKITDLDISNNEITELNDYFPLCLTHITKLDLSVNKLTVLPDNFGNLVNLRYLDLSKNSISTVPLSFGKLRFLNWLDLSGNPLFPKISQLVGVCTSTSDCQNAAKKLVTFMAELSYRVLLEKERIKKNKILENEQAELELLKKKEKKEKKKKKKLMKEMESRNGKTEMNSIENDELMKQQVHSYPQIPNSIQPSIVWRLVGAAVRVCFYLMLLSCFGVFVVKLVDEPTYLDMKSKAAKYAGEISELLPTQVVTWFDQMVKLYSVYGQYVWKRLTDIGQGVIVWITHFYRWLSTDPTVQLYLDSVWNLFHIVYVQVMDVSIGLYVRVYDWIYA